MSILHKLIFITNFAYEQGENDLAAAFDRQNENNLLSMFFQLEQHTYAFDKFWNPKRSRALQSYHLIDKRYVIAFLNAEKPQEKIAIFEKYIEPSDEWNNLAVEELNRILLHLAKAYSQVGKPKKTLLDDLLSKNAALPLVESIQIAMSLGAEGYVLQKRTLLKYILVKSEQKLVAAQTISECLRNRSFLLSDDDVTFFTKEALELLDQVIKDRGSCSNRHHLYCRSKLHPLKASAAYEMSVVLKSYKAGCNEYYQDVLNLVIEIVTDVHLDKDKSSKLLRACGILLEHDFFEKISPEQRNNFLAAALELCSMNPDEASGTRHENTCAMQVLVLRKLDRYKEALILAESQAQNPGHVLREHFLVETVILAGLLQDSAKLHQLLKQDLPSNIEGLIWNELNKLGEKDSAEYKAMLQKIISAEKISIETLIGHCSSFIFSNTMNALQFLLENERVSAALAQEMDSPFNYVFFAYCYSKLGKIDEAQKLLLKAKSLLDSVSFNRCGNAYRSGWQTVCEHLKIDENFLAEENALELLSEKFDALMQKHRAEATKK